MVKNIPQEIKPEEELESGIEAEKYSSSSEESGPSSQELQSTCPISNRPKRGRPKLNKLPEKFENTAVGCLIQFLRTKSPCSLEEIVQHVKKVEHNLVTSQGKKFIKDAFGIADYAISWNPKLFLLDRHFNYYLNEAKAKEAEESFKNRDARKAQQDRESRERCNKRLERQVEKRKSWARIRQTIMNDLSGDMEEPSYLTKAFLILTSDNREQAISLTKEIRLTYAEMIRNNSNRS